MEEKRLAHVVVLQEFIKFSQISHLKYMKEEVDSKNYLFEF